jgi:hypothetical protein
MAICAQSVMAAANLAIQGHADVVLPIGQGQARPVSCYFVTVAASGERKSACDTEATAPIRRREQALRERYDLDLPAYDNERLAWEKARETATQSAKGDRAEIKRALDKIGPPPKSAVKPLLTCPDPTFEGLCKLFIEGQPSLGIFSSECGQFIGGHGMSPDNKLRTAAGLSDLWDGGMIRRVRSGDGTVILPGRRLAMHLMAQPAVAGILFGDALLADQGLLSRLLVTAPDPAAGTRFFGEERPETDRDLRRYSGRLLTIQETPLPLVTGKLNELAPRQIVMSEPAKEAYRAFSDHVETAIAPGGDLAPVAGLANKLAEHAARLAAVLTLVRDIDAGEIGAGEMADGIAIAQHYANEALRLFGVSGTPPELRLAQLALDWMLSLKWGKDAISLPDLYQRGPNAIRDGAIARKIVHILAEHGWLVPAPPGTEIDGVRRQEVWRIIRGYA